MIEREVLLTGVGGQSVQLAAQVLGRAAARESRQVMLLGTYGGTMRGGNTDSTVVVGNAPLVSPPMVSRAWSLLAMHHNFFEPLRKKLRPGSVLVLNSSLFEAEVDREAWRVFDVPATKIATDLGSPLAASMVLTAAFAALTGLVGLDSLVAAMRDSVPPYRKQHVEANESALRAGWGAVPHGVAPAWEGERAA